MLFYFGWITLIILLLLFKPRGKNINIGLVFTLLILLYGCRNYGSPDDFAYIRAFNAAASGGMVFGLESSFVLISNLLSRIGFNYKGIFLFYSIISFVFMYLAYNRICSKKSDWLIAVLGFITFSFFPTITVMRQFAAIAIVTYAFVLKFKGAKYKPIFLILFSSLFHNAAIFMLLVLPLLKRNVSLTFKLMLPIISLFIGFTGSLNKLLHLLTPIIPYKYHIYGVYNYQHMRQHQYQLFYIYCYY